MPVPTGSIKSPGSPSSRLFRSSEPETAQELNGKRPMYLKHFCVSQLLLLVTVHCKWIYTGQKRLKFLSLKCYFKIISLCLLTPDHMATSCRMGTYHIPHFYFPLKSFLIHKNYFIFTLLISHYLLQTKFSVTKRKKYAKPETVYMLLMRIFSLIVSCLSAMKEICYLIFSPALSLTSPLFRVQFSFSDLFNIYYY